MIEARRAEGDQFHAERFQNRERLGVGAVVGEQTNAFEAARQMRGHLSQPRLEKDEVMDGGIGFGQSLAVEGVGIEDGDFHAPNFEHQTSNVKHPTSNRLRAYVEISPDVQRAIVCLIDDSAFENATP